MGWVMYYGRFIPHQRVKSSAIRSTDASKSVVLRLNALERVDEELVKGNERVALSLVKDLQGKPDGLRCFGAARQVPQRLYTLDELKLNSIDTLSLLSPVDATLGQIERNLQLAAIFGGLSAYVGFDLNQLQVSFGGGVSNLFLDMIGHAVSPKYRNRVIQHEAGHFLIAYLLGVLPRGYTLSSLEALRKEGSLNVQAGTAFVDFEFLEEVNAGKVSAKTLNQFSCIALAGVATEYLLFGCSEGGLGDIRQVGFAFLGLKECELQDEFEWRWMMIHARDLEPLNPHLLACYHISKRSALDGLLKSLGFTQKKADFQVRWAVLNTILILRRHEGARSELAEAMASGSSVGHCIDTIERAIDSEDV